MPKVSEDEILGVARVIQVYNMKGSKKATIGGSLVEEGQMVRNASFRVIRGGKVRLVYESVLVCILSACTLHSKCVDYFH